MMRNQWHALIYTDGYIAITMYERCYAMWYFKAYNRKIAGVVGGGALHTPGEWRLDAAKSSEIYFLPAIMPRA